MLSPLYVAVIECVSTDRADVDNAAVPPTRLPLPTEMVPSKNVIVPVAEEGETVPVKVTDCPRAEGLRLDVIDVDELVFVYQPERPLKLVV